MQYPSRNTPARGGKNLLAKQVYNVLLDLIVKNELPPGLRLNVDDLGRQLGISRSPIASALNALERDGFLALHPKSGTVVRPLSRNELNAIYLSRAALERVVAAFAVGATAPERLQSLRERFLAFPAMATPGEAEILAAFELDMEFHNFLAGFLPEIVHRQYQITCDLTRRSRLLYLKHELKTGDVAGRIGKSVEAHVKILEALLEKRGERCAELLEHNVVASKEAILDFLYGKSGENSDADRAVGGTE